MRPSEGGSKKKKKKGEVWCTRNPPAHRQLSVYPLQDTGTEHEGPSGEPAGIRSPSDSPADRCCCGASTLGSQGTCLGPATGSGGMEPRLGAFLPLMVSAGHTHTHTHTREYTHTHMFTQRQGPRAELDVPLPHSTKGDGGPEWWSGITGHYLPAQGHSLSL